MPLLDWVNRNQAADTAENVPYHLLNLEATYGTERNGTERNGTERNGTERNGTERNGTERKI